MIENIVILGLCMLLATYKFVKMFIDERGIYKLKTILLWIALYDLNILVNIGDQVKRLSIIDCGFMVIGMVCGYVYSIWVVVKSEFFWERISAIILWCYVSFVFAVFALEIQRIELLCIFKVWLMLTLLMGLIAFKKVIAVGQIIGAIILYIIMISANAILSNEFLVAASEYQFWRGVYETIQRSYCLNPINIDLSDVEARIYIIDFFVCRITDMIMLGFLSTRFLEIMDTSNMSVGCGKE